MDEMVERYVEATGGRERLEALSALRLRGTMEVSGLAGPYSILTSSAGRCRMDGQLDGWRIVTAYDGEQAWQVSPAGPDPVILDEKRRALFVEDTCDLLGPLVNAARKGHRLDFVGEEEIDGVDAYHLRVTLASGRIQEWFLSTETFLPVKKLVPGWTEWFGDHQAITWFLDYEQHHGLTLPGLTERESAETFVTSYSLETVEINPEVPGSAFSPPLPQRDPASAKEGVGGGERPDPR